MITVKRIVKICNELGKASFKKGYRGDAVDYWYQSKNLELLEQINKNLKGMQKQIKYMWQSLDSLELVDEEIKK